MSEKRAELLKSRFLRLIKDHYQLEMGVEEIEGLLFIHIAIPHGSDYAGYTPHTRIINPET
ncbi:MAG: hypothetical protein H6765_09505 [Candidatus Peribacteria bacterium]|nr:MAG: hypothetical protein H6765_09505 [Candidatus Peribacteria bacterium]